MGFFDIFKKNTGKNSGAAPAPESPESPKGGITVCPELGAIIPEKFHEKINELIADYKTLSDSRMYKKYDLSELWFDLEEYKEEKEDGDLLGFLIVDCLVNEGYILQLDWKEDVSDYLDELPVFWDGDVKVVSFDLDNDQYYLAKVPQGAAVRNIFEVSVRDYE